MRGRKRKGKKLVAFRLFPETHQSLLQLMRELEIEEVEKLVRLLVATFRALLHPPPNFRYTEIPKPRISAIQKLTLRKSLGDLHSRISAIRKFPIPEFPLYRNSISAIQKFSLRKSLINQHFRISAIQKFNFRYTEIPEFPLYGNSQTVGRLAFPHFHHTQTVGRLAFQNFRYTEIPNFRYTVFQLYREITDREELPKPLRDLALNPLSEGSERKRSLTPPPIYNIYPPLKNKKNKKNKRIRDISLQSSIPYGMEDCASSSTLVDEDARDRDRDRDRDRTVSPMREKEEEKNKNIYTGETENHFQSQRVEVEEKGLTPREVPDRPIGGQRFEEAKISNQGIGLGHFATHWETSTFFGRMEEHRKRLSLLLQRKGLKWKVERLVKVVKEWEREWGEWREEWDEYLVDVLRYFHESRVVGRIRKVSFGEVEPNFPYLVVPVLKMIKEAEAVGKEVVETPLGDVKLRKERGKLSVKEVLSMWNERAEKEKLLRRTELTPSLRAEIETYLKLHPEREWWEKVFSLVPFAIRKTRNPSEPREMGWLFRGRPSGKIIDWVASLEGREKERETRTVTEEKLKEVLRALEERGVGKEELWEFLRRRGVKVEKRENGRVLYLFSWDRGEEVVERFFSLVALGRTDEAVKLVKEVER